jgi:hypothetical protein
VQACRRFDKYRAAHGRRHHAGGHRQSLRQD